MPNHDPARLILLCLDMEAGSTALARYAERTARHCGDQLQVLHVTRRDTTPDAEQRLLDDIRRLLTEAGLDSNAVPIEIEAGIPDEVIPVYAAQSGASLILLGRRQRRTVERIYVGSTTSAVISLAKVPVLVAPLARETVADEAGR